MGARTFAGIRLRTETVGARAGRVYRLELEVPHYERRRVEIRFEKRAAKTPRIIVDGPASPHRYGDKSLCIWYPWDPPEQRWVFRDGLLALINHIQAHLFREAWWREAGEWLGPQAPHGPPDKPAREGTISSA